LASALKVIPQRWVVELRWLGWNSAAAYGKTVGAIAIATGHLYIGPYWLSA
jgi:hypothetical protein